MSQNLALRLTAHHHQRRVARGVVEREKTEEQHARASRGDLCSALKAVERVSYV